MSKKVQLNEYEYSRILFLNEVINKENKFNFLNDNRKFFLKLEDKFQHGVDEKNKLIVTKYISNNNDDLMFKNREFFEILNFYVNKFKSLYGLYGVNCVNVLNGVDGLNSNLNLYKSTFSVSKQENKIDVQKKMIEDLYFVYLPFSRFLYKESYSNFRFNNSPIICGIQAHTGCGKTTMTQIIKFVMEKVYDMNTAILSIDDLYKTYDELKELKKSDSRFKYRGPPGTHDLSLSLQTLESIRRCKTGFEIPRYSKSSHGGLGDRAEKGDTVTKIIDVLLFEGWFVGSDPVEEAELECGQADQAKLEFQKLINSKLSDYQSLWGYVNYWVILKPKKFEYSRKWRAQAEKVNKQGMSYKQMQEFLNYFWLSIPPHIYFPKIEKKRSPILTITLDKYRNFYI